MVCRSIFLFVVALAAVAATPAAGQESQAGQVARRLAACLVRSRPAVAQAYVAHGTPAIENSLYDRMFNAGCLPNEGSPPLDPRLVRGLIYEALYDRDFARAAPATFENVPRLVPPDGGTDPALEAALLRFGECVARADPQASRNLLAARPASPGETAAIAALTPRLSPCMQGGLTITFSAPILRGVVAEALYKLSRAAPAAANR